MNPETTHLIGRVARVLSQVHAARQRPPDNLDQLLVGLHARGQLFCLADHVCRNLAAEIPCLVVPAVFFSLCFCFRGRNIYVKH